MSSTSGNMGEKYCQEFGPIFFDMSSASGNIMGLKYVQEFGPRFLACNDPNLACHGLSISCVSMSRVSCRVIILRVSVSVPCRGHPELDYCRAGPGCAPGFITYLSPLGDHVWSRFIFERGK